MDTVTERKPDLLRILLAEDDDVEAFLLHCEINRLPRPCSFGRINKPELLADKLQSFEPDVLILAGSFAHPQHVRLLRRSGLDLRIICLVTNIAQADAALAAGAHDSLLVSQISALAVCLEQRSENAAPSYKTVRTSGPAAFGSASALQQLITRGQLWLGSRRVKALQAWRDFGLKAAALGSAAQTWLLARIDAVKKSEWLKYKPMRPKEPVSSARSRVIPQNEPVNVRLNVLRAEPAAFAPPSEPGDSEALRSLEISFKTLFHASLDAIFLLDAETRFVHSNAAGGVLLNTAPAELLGRKLIEYVPKEDAARLLKLWELLLIEEQQKGELKLRSAAGSLRQINFSARANLWCGVHLFIAKDVTELTLLRKESATAVHLSHAGGS